MQYTFINHNKEHTVEIPNEYIQRNMRSLNISAKEACEMYLSDEGYIENDVVAALNEKANGNKKRKGPTRKEDPIKRALVHYIFECIDGKAFSMESGTIVCDNAAVMNPERVIRFNIDDDIYELTLSRKRKPKA